MYSSIILVAVGVVLTGFGLYAKIGKFGGSGASIPITGFANAVVSPAIEYRREGLIFGTGAKMFIIVGPVLAYGISTSVIIGFIYYVSKFWF